MVIIIFNAATEPYHELVMIRTWPVFLFDGFFLYFYFLIYISKLYFTLVRFADSK